MDTSTMRQKKSWGAGVIILGLMGLIGYQVTRADAVVTFYTPEEVYAAPENFLRKSFRVSGLVLAGTKVWNPNTQQLTFRMTDLKGHEFQVAYKGTPPDLFQEGQGVVVQGTLQSAYLESNNWINASLLMVKHSEEYDTTKDPNHPTRMKEGKLLDSLLMPQGGKPYAASP